MSAPIAQRLQALDGLSRSTTHVGAPLTELTN
jgi:hypothetical protein